MLYIQKVRSVKTPNRAHETDSGIDFYIPNDIDYVVPARGSLIIPLGVKVVIPEGKDLVFHNKSWIASKNGIILWAQVVDNWFTWELGLNLINTTWREYVAKAGNKIAQGILRKVELDDIEVVDEEDFENENMKKTTVPERGVKWFGSTGLL